ncbi:chromosome partition protein [Sorangium cellulosum]|uniref:Chromosome partition protein n=1 Tax=Sorangium cellulosum TaxID=56 RepID=A0A2L0EJ49_SORCE|nr:ATP-binding protein [Sorangium cellulosum]AUX39330.1 chromosome partition protein [Sorangium cellulosum]
MITRLEVDGFKSLREFTVDFEPFTVLVGPNSAGKSNILDALALLSRLATRPIEEAFKQGRGRSIDQFTRWRGEAGRAIRFAVEVLLPDVVESGETVARSHRYRYELVIERRARPTGAEHLVVRDERLRVLEREEERLPDPGAELASPERTAHGGQDVFAQRFETKFGRRVAVCATPEDIHYQAVHTHTALASLHQRLGDVLQPLTPGEGVAEPQGEQSRRGAGVVQRRAIADRRLSGPDPWRERISAVADELSSFRLLQLDIGRLREPSERIGTGALAPDASNLATVLADLPAPLLGEIRAELVALVPGISSFHVEPEGDSFHIDFELSGGERLPARLVSDGMLRLLAILTVLRGQPSSAVIGIEEPENGVYPGRLRRLLTFLREAALEQRDGAPVEQDASAPIDAAPIEQPRWAWPPQILLTSHSPVILAALRSAPQHIRFIDTVRRDGQLVSRARRVAVAPGTDRGRLTVSLREINALLDAAGSEAAE